MRVGIVRASGRLFGSTLPGSRWWAQPIDGRQTKCCTALIALRKSICGVGVNSIVASVLRSSGRAVTEPIQEKLLNYIQLLSSTGKTHDQLLAFGTAYLKGTLGARSSVYGVVEGLAR